MIKRKLANFIFFWIFLTNLCTLLTVVGAVSAYEGYSAGGKRDPFVSLVVGSRQGSEFMGLEGVRGVKDIEIQGVVIDEATGSYVIANGVVLLEGETQDGVTAVEIEAGGILFSIFGQNEFKSFSNEEDLQ